MQTASAAEVSGGSSSTKLPSELADLTARLGKLEGALAIAKMLDEARHADGIVLAKNQKSGAGAHDRSGFARDAE